MRFDKILVPLDGSLLAEAALPKAVELIRHNPGGTLILLRAAEATILPGVDLVRPCRFVDPRGRSREEAGLDHDEHARAEWLWPSRPRVGRRVRAPQRKHPGLSDQGRPLATGDRRS